MGQVGSVLSDTEAAVFKAGEKEPAGYMLQLQELAGITNKDL